MKTKIKRHYRSVLSVVLSVCMLVSCMTVGIIATDAAQSAEERLGAADDSNELGWSNGDNFHYSLNSATWDDVSLSSGSGELAIGTANSSLEFGFKVGGNWYAKDSSQSNPGYDNSTAKYTAKKGSGISNYKLSSLPAGTYRIELVSTSGDDLTYRFYKKSNPVCTGLTLAASTSTLETEAATFTLTASTSTAQSGDISYAFYKNDGTQLTGSPVVSNTGTATLSGLTQDHYSEKYYVIASKTDYDSVTSDKISVTNTAYTTGEKTVYIGAVSHIVDWYKGEGDRDPEAALLLSELKLKYWKSTDTSDYDSVTGSYTGKIVKKRLGSSYWDNAEKDFYIYRFTVPAGYDIMQATIQGNTSHYYGTGDSVADYNTIYIWDYSGDQHVCENVSYTTSDLTVESVDNATVTATYGGTAYNEGQTISDVLEGDSVSISVAPNKGYECSAVTGTYTGGSTDATGSGTSWTLAMPGHDTTVVATIQPVSWKRVYFNNYHTRYAMVTAYVQYDDGTKPLGIGQTMTRLPNSNTWYIEVPGDVDYITFIGDGGVNTNDSTKYPSNPQNMMPIPWGTYTNPKYNPGKANHNPPTVTNGGTWGEYTERTNEYTVSAGSTLNDPENHHLFTGITATLYDYFVDGELPTEFVDGELLTEKENWLTGISTSEKYDYSTNDGNKFKWNPYRKLNDALDSYARETSTAVPLYFGNLNGVATGTTNDLIKIENGDHANEYYYNWRYEANNSQGLDGDHKAATGLSGKKLQDNNIHYYSSSDTTNENGAIMAMFDEDFLSGENILNKNLATILRASTFPVRVDDISSAPTELYLVTNEGWETAGAIFKADFYNTSTTESTKRLVSATKVCDNVYKVTIPQGYSKVQWWRMNPSSPNSNPWNYGTEDTIPTNDNCVFKVTGWNKTGTWTNSYTDDGETQTITLGSHKYYEFDSTEGKDNAYITDIDREDKTANINYYNDSQNHKVHAAGMGSAGDWGFYPFDFDRSGSTKSDDTLAHDLGFGMKLEIPFTLEQNGEFADGTHQVFDFSGDDDLWVFVDGNLVLDLGGDHKKTTGSIDFASKTITNTVEGGNYVINGTRNGSFDWFDNSNPNQPHTMTIYYMERGMFDSNLKFGFSFHAIPNQYKTEKKLKTSNINGGFYKTNDQAGAASNESADLTLSEGRFISKFEETYQNEFFTIQQKVNGKSIQGAQYTIGTSTKTVGSNNSYQLQNDDIAYFIDEFGEDDVITLKEIFGSSNLYNYEPILTVHDDGNNKKEFVVVPSATNAGEVSGNNTDGYSFMFKPTSTAVNALGNLNIRGLFTNQMKQHSLTLSKAITGDPDTTTEFTFRITFKFGDYDYISYPLEIFKNGVKTALSDTGEVTLVSTDVVEIPKIPENAKIKIEEVNIASTYNYNNISVTGATSTLISNGALFTMGESDITATINNSAFSGFTVTKQLQYSPSGTQADPDLVDYPDTQSKFRIKIETSKDNSTWTAYAGKAFTSSDTSRTDALSTDVNGITTIKRGEKLSFNGIEVNTYIRVTEDTQRSTYASDNFTTPTAAHMPLDYQYVKTEAYNGNTSIGTNDTDGYYKGTKFQLSSGRVDVTVTNIKPRYRWIAKYKHSTRKVGIANPSVTESSIWGDVWYHSEGVFTADELLEYTEFAMVVPSSDVSGEAKYGIRFKDNDTKAKFLMNKTPYQDNFKETVTWNLKNANVGFYYNESNGSQLSITPSETLDPDLYVDISFRLPCKMELNNEDDQWLPVGTVNGESALVDGVPKAEFAADGIMPDENSSYYTQYFKKDSAYADWYTFNDVHVGSTSETPQFLYAPEVVYDVDKGTPKYFQYWSIRTMANDSSDSVEYAKCYYKEFNYALYQSSIVYAVYGDTQQSHNVIARSVESSANLTFLETSRNQWNQDATNSNIIRDFGGADNARHGDRLFVDFVLDLHYVNKDGQNVLLNSITDTSNYKAGLLIETVRDLNSTEVDTVNKKMLKTDKQIAASFKPGDNITAQNNALAYLATDMSDKTTYLNSNINLSKLDNKNQIEFAYSFANISQGATSVYRTETARKTKLYRAYAYLIHTGGGEEPDPDNEGSMRATDVKIISEPIYFTIYDMASITNDYDDSVTR